MSSSDIVIDREVDVRLSQCRTLLFAENCCLGIIQPRETEAYANAVEHLKIELGLKDGDFLSTGNHATMQDVRDAVDQAKQGYQNASESHSRARKSLEKLATRIMYYGRVFDVLAQHHPEYVALAWGSLKFVLMGIINHANLVEKLAQAITAIGDILPRAELSAELYQTDLMKTALSRLYGSILLFFQLCMKWFNKSSAGRLWASIKTPFELRYEPIFEQIQDCSTLVDDLSNTGMRVEIRGVRTLTESCHSKGLDIDRRLQEIETKLDISMKQLWQLGVEHKSITERVGDEVRIVSKRVFRIELHHVSFLRRSVLPAIPSPGDIGIEETILEWAYSEHSTLLLVEVQPGAQTRAKEITADVIKHLRAGNHCVFWNISLGPLAGLHNNRLVYISQVLKTIIFQALKQLGSDSAQLAEQLRLDKINAAHTDTEWADLISLLLAKLPQCYIVIDSEDLQHAYQHDSQWTNRLITLLENIVEKTTSAGGLIKILLVANETKNKTAIETCKNKRTTMTSLKPVILLPPHKKHMARRTGLDATKWKTAKPKI
ncbi:hypothetical protein B0J11DRAFT_547899 [Dendryphion nanum]|uniref:DUF7708 domain-containing protein n=1 Tax=Dendryphion nanum TaxID=256645 RepID=A0A9P9IQV5_9PLEO|nr:hypothetical protein B0J11DRAFT_547899 [Dendryphion nanum]